MAMSDWTDDDISAALRQARTVNGGDNPEMAPAYSTADLSQALWDKANPDDPRARVRRMRGAMPVNPSTRDAVERAELSTPPRLFGIDNPGSNLAASFGQHLLDTGMGIAEFPLVAGAHTYSMFTNPTPYLDQTPDEKKQTAMHAFDASTLAAGVGLVGSKPSNAVGSFGGNLIPFKPKKPIPEGYGVKPTPRDAEVPVMDAIQNGKNISDTMKAADPLLKQMHDRYGYSVMQRGLPSDPSMLGNSLLTLNRALREVELDPRYIDTMAERVKRVIDAGIQPLQKDRVTFNHGAYFDRPLGRFEDGYGGEIALGIPLDAKPSEIASYILDNNLYSNNERSALSGALIRGAGDDKIANALRAARDVDPLGY